MISCYLHFQAERLELRVLLNLKVLFYLSAKYGNIIKITLENPL